MFYGPAVLTLVWCIFWYFRVFETPEMHSSISNTEREYIVSSRAAKISNKSDKNEDLRMYELICKIPFWAYVVGQIGKDFAALVAISLFPMYINRKLEIN